MEYNTYYHCYMCRYYDCGWMSDTCHQSPNESKVGSFVYAAEAWLLKQGGTIPSRDKLPGMFQGMLDDYTAREVDDND
jgi:hypothetical protein